MLLSASTIIHTMFRLYTQNWRLIVHFILLAFLPSALLAFLGFGAVYLSAAIPTSELLNDIIIALLKLGSVGIAFWASLALALASKDMVQNQPTLNWKTYLSMAAKFFVPTAAAVIIVKILVGLGTLFLFIPGILAYVWLALTRYAILFDDKKVFGAMSFSKQLTRGRWWPVAWRLLISGAIFVLLLVICIIFLSLPFVFLPNSPGTPGAVVSSTEVILSILIRLLGPLAVIIVTPTLIISHTLIYLNLRDNPLPAPAPLPSVR